MNHRPPYEPVSTFEQLIAESEALRNESAQLVRESREVIELINKPAWMKFPAAREKVKRLT